MESASYHQFDLSNGNVCRVEVLTPHLFRLRVRPDANFVEPPLLRYGILRRQWPACHSWCEDDESSILLRTENASLRVQFADGQFELRDAQNNMLTRAVSAPRSDMGRGFGAELSLDADDKLYGLGDVARECVERRGQRVQMWVRNVAAYVPNPVCFSSRGWGVFFNTTWRHQWDLGAAQPDVLQVQGRRGELDLYLMVGADLPSLLETFGELAGKPALLPRWAYGLTFVCNQQASAREMLDDCLAFRREQIPCDLVGLEPGWMSQRYDYSTEKQWHPERFFVPPWNPIGPHTFLAAAQRLGFKVSLWLCCNYDLLYEEERQLQEPHAATNDENARDAAFHADDFERDARLQGHGLRMDKITDPARAWFEHLKPFVDQGVRAFKLDGADQIEDHPDRKWGQGLHSEALPLGFMDDEEMHNLYSVLLNKQMTQGYARHTGQRAMVYSAGGYTGIAQYSATWAGDTGGGAKPLVSLLNHGLSGHSNTSVDMDVFTPEGIHCGFWQPWSQLSSWAYWRHPWLLGQELEPVFKFYARLRYRLLPYLYSTAHQAARTAMPMLRALPLVFPDDARACQRLNHYMLGDAFLVTAFTSDLHLPPGRWIDYWSGQSSHGPLDMDYQPPTERGGALFVRAGSIIPMAPPMDYANQMPLETVELHVYPEGESRFALWEDDGETLDYQNGAVARTDIECRADESQLALTITPRQGQYRGMPQQRAYDVVLHLDAPPRHVEINGQTTDGGQWNRGQWRVHLAEDAERQRAIQLALHW